MFLALILADPFKSYHPISSRLILCFNCLLHINSNLYAKTKTAKIPLSTGLAIGLLHESVQLLLKIAQYWAC